MPFYSCAIFGGGFLVGKCAVGKLDLYTKDIVEAERKVRSVTMLHLCGRRRSSRSVVKSSVASAIDHLVGDRAHLLESVTWPRICKNWAYSAKEMK